MPADVLLAVLFAAVMHACYHAIIKLGDDKIAAVAVIAVFEALYGMAGSFVFPMPPPAAWFWILIAVTLQTVYRFFVCYAYRLGDLSQVMPIARGTAPLLVTMGSALWLGETLGGLQLVAIAVIAVGIMTLAFARTAARRFDGRAGVVAMFSGLVVAGYSMVDGIGVRVTGNAASYVWWLTMVGGFVFLVPALAMRPVQAVTLLRARWYVGALGAMFSLGTYWIVMWAMMRAPIGLVSALRETGVIFAVIIGVVFLKERPGALRIAAVALAAAGIVMLKLAS
jgi:drug/metabolite transporter (DMT)-like permease